MLFADLVEPIKDFFNWVVYSYRNNRFFEFRVDVGIWSGNADCFFNKMAKFVSLGHYYYISKVRKVWKVREVRSGKLIFAAGAVDPTEDSEISTN